MSFQVISKNYLDTSVAQLKSSRLPFAPSDLVFPNNLALYLKDLKLLVFAIPTLKLVASSLE